MSKTILLLCCLICAILTHKDGKAQNEPIKSIYEPFTDVPKPSQQEPLAPTSDEAAEIDHDHEQLPANKQKQYEDFNEMLKYGLVLGTILLSFMLMKTCSINGRPQRGQRVLLAPASANYMTRTPILNKNNSYEVRSRIQWHQSEIKRLELESKQLEEAQKRALEESQRQFARRGEGLKYWSNQMQMHETMQTNQYSQRVPYHYEYYQNIPMGRPLPRDTDSSFASEYPTI